MHVQLFVVGVLRQSNPYTKELSATRTKVNHAIGGMREFPMWFGREKIARRLLAACVFVVASSLASTGAWGGPREKGLTLYRQGRQYEDKGDYAKAAESLERAAKLLERAYGPNHP